MKKTYNVGDTVLVKERWSENSFKAKVIAVDAETGRIGVEWGAWGEGKRQRTVEAKDVLEIKVDKSKKTERKLKMALTKPAIVTGICLLS